MKAVKIDLSENNGPCCPETMPMAKAPEKYYPTIHIVKDEKVAFPHDGKMTVTFHKVSSTESDRGGKKRYECTLEIREIVELETEKGSKPSYKESENALDALMAEKKSKNSEDEESY